MEVGFWVEKKQQDKIESSQGCADPDIVYPAARAVFDEERGDQGPYGRRAGYKNRITGVDPQLVHFVDLSSLRTAYPDIMAARS